MVRRPSTLVSIFVAFLCLAGSLLAGCSGSRSLRSGGAGCGAAPAASCECPCPAPAADCSPCGPRPVQAKSGEAWCCVWVPPVQGVAQESVCVKPESSRCVYVPPTYGSRIKLVCEAPSRMEERKRPGIYAVQHRDVLVKPARECVRPICCPPGDLAPGEQQCGCLIKEEKPAVWGEECCRVCLEPERLCVEYTPASYKCVEERYQISPGFTQKVCEPAQYETRTRDVCTQPGRWEWRKNDKCVVPVQLEALQLEMVDSNADGSAAGIFRVGAQVRYDVKVTSDTASGAMEGLTVTFQLPAELEFVSGSAANGVTITGAGQSAASSAFSLAGEASLKLFIVAKVKSAPAKELLQVSATVRSGSGVELATESESSTVPNLP